MDTIYLGSKVIIIIRSSSWTVSFLCIVFAKSPFYWKGT